MGLREQAAKGIVWSAARTWGSRAVSFLVTLVLARLVLPEAFGLIAYATVFIAFTQIFVDQGFSDAIVQCPRLERQHLDTAFWISLLIGILLTGIGVLASARIAQLFHEPQLAPIVGWLSIGFIFSALSSVQQAILRRRLAFKSLALRSLVAISAGGFVAVIMAFLGFGVWSLVAKMLVGGLAGVITLWQISDWRPGFNATWSHFKELFSFGINIVGSNFVDFFSLHGDDFLIGYFLGPVALGYYSIAYSLLIAMSDLLISVPNAVLFPTFSRLQSEYERMRQSFCEVAKLQSIVAFPIFIGISIMAPEVVNFLYGKTWNPSIPVIQILMFKGIIQSATYLYSSVIKAVGKPSWRLFIWTLTAILNLAGFFLVVRRGIIAVALVYVLVGYLVLPLYFLIIKYLIHVPFWTHLQQYIPALCSSIVMIGVVFGLKSIIGNEVEFYTRMFILVSCGALTYFLVLNLIQPKLTRQLTDLAHLILPRLRSKTS